MDHLIHVFIVVAYAAVKGTIIGMIGSYVAARIAIRLRNRFGTQVCA